MALRVDVGRSQIGIGIFLKKTYFASDVHLGSDLFGPPVEREKQFVRWLDTIKADAEALYLLGDIFDFWFEYKKVVPRGFTRFLGKLCELQKRMMVTPSKAFRRGLMSWI
ncbi:UDP-2,3-diacylglucosamine hydrolase [Candidatus Symbiothrix dinenymphae]|nr:UDP-2,3-diacylglucosamine hydrolase [Candidatus Symbiothrix dinenymphae]